MKNLLAILFLSFMIIGCDPKRPIPEGRVESINYPDFDNWLDLYTTSEWTAFYKMKKVSFITPEGVLEEKLVVADSFSSEVPLSKEEAMELSMSRDAVVVKTVYSTKEFSPSWKKNLSFQKKILRREGSKVVFEEEKGQTEMTYIDFLKEKEALGIGIGCLLSFCLIGFFWATIKNWETKKNREVLLIVALIVWVVFSFLFSSWTDAFNLEIILTIFTFIFSGIFLERILFVFEKIKKQKKRNKIKKQNKLKHVDTSPK